MMEGNSYIFAFWIRQFKSSKIQVLFWFVNSLIVFLFATLIKQKGGNLKILCHFLTSFSIYPACEVIFFRQLGSNLNIKICKKQFRNTSQCEPNTQGLVANSTVFCRITVIVIPFLGVQVQISTILHSFSIRLTFQPGFMCLVF